MIYTDADWYVVNKPTNISTHGAWEGDLALVEWLELHFSERLHVCSRLDKGTSGVLPFARSSTASGEAQRVHEEESAEKRYLFVSTFDARSSGRGGTWTDESTIEEKTARTRFELIGSRGEFFFYEARLARGRTHQVRIHAARGGVPLLGDEDYGGSPFPRLMLHCAEVRWPRRGGGEPHLWMASKPESFRAIESGVSRTEAALACARDRRPEFLKQVTSAFRILHRGEAPFVRVEGEVAVDLFAPARSSDPDGDEAPYLCVWWYGNALAKSGADEKVRNDALESLAHAWGARGVIIRNVNKDAHRRGLVSDLELIGDAPPAEFEVRESGLRFVVTLSERQHVGLFLDQRDNRARLAKVASGARVANLFSYSCSFSTVAARAACEVVFSVDAAESALTLGKRNFDLNGLTASRRGKFIAEDVRVFLDRQARKVAKDGPSAKFDIIVCDPPTFSSTRAKGVFHVAQEWSTLVDGCARLLASGGTAFFSTNHRAGEEEVYFDALRARFAAVSRLSAPLDFPGTKRDATHVKLFQCRGT